MNLKFKFDCEEQWSIVEVPPNLLLAYEETKAERRNSIFLYLMLTILSFFFCYNSQAKILPILIGKEWGAISIIAVTVFLSLLIKWMCNRTPESIELFCCIMIKNFDTYIDDIIGPLDAALSHNNRIMSRMPEKFAKKIEKTLITAQKLKEINAECMDSQYDLHDNIQFVEKYIDDLYGLKIEKVVYKNEKIKGEKRRRSRGSTFSFRRPNNNGERKG
jgi:hypothetical protein